MSWTTCFLIYFKTFWETYEHEMNINNIQLFFFLRNLFQSTRLHIKGILRVVQQFSAW